MNQGRITDMILDMMFVLCIDWLCRQSNMTYHSFIIWIIEPTILPTNIHLDYYDYYFLSLFVCFYYFKLIIRIKKQKKKKEQSNTIVLLKQNSLRFEYFHVFWFQPTYSVIA